jgi:hypothetical protein
VRSARAEPAARREDVTVAVLTRERTADGAPTDGDPARATAGAQVQALIAEARRRRRTRLVRLGGVALFVVIALLVGLTWPHQPAAGKHSRPAATGRLPSARANGEPLLVWVTASGSVMIGNLHTLSARPVADADVDFSAPLVPSGGLVYWIKQSGGYVDGADWPQTVEALDPATGRNVAVTPGEYVFKSATGQRVYAALSDTSVTELPSGSGSADLTLPAGWYLPGGDGIAVADGIIVQSKDTPAIAHPAELAVWNPATGRLRAIGRADGAITAYTPAGAGYSLLAWMPAGCRLPSCPITITNTATLASRTLVSPLHHGFVLGGAFSPDGRQLAVFVNVGSAASQTAELAIVSTVTGAARLVPGVRMTVGEDDDWVRWLPGGTSLITQANRDYVVNTVTMTARPFRFAGHGQDFNFSAELIPAVG